VDVDHPVRGSGEDFRPQDVPISDHDAEVGAKVAQAGGEHVADRAVGLEHR
jgi:hypothetical protein